MIDKVNNANAALNPNSKTLAVSLEQVQLQDQKENMGMGQDAPVVPGEDVVEIELKKAVGKIGNEGKPAPTVKELEAEEPLLQENPHRFVLFPIKYHEVRSCLSICSLRVDSYAS